MNNKERVLSNFYKEHVNPNDQEKYAEVMSKDDYV